MTPPEHSDRPGKRLTTAGDLFHAPRSLQNYLRAQGSHPHFVVFSLWFNHMMKTGGRSLFKAIDAGSYPFCGTTVSRSPSHALAIKYKCATAHKMDFKDISVTAIREPLQRLLSHFRMLIQHKNKNKPQHGTMPFDNPKFLGDGEKPSFEYFLEHFPDEYKIHQLYFYSEDGDIDEAFTNITKNTQIILTENQQEGLDKLSNLLRHDPRLKEFECHPSQTTKDIDFKPTEKQIALAQDILKDEYTFYNKVIDYYNNEE